MDDHNIKERKRSNSHSNDLANEYRHLIGKKLVELDQEKGNFERGSNQVLESELPKPNRIFKPGRRYSTDYNENRYNFVVNSSGQIVNVNNG